MRLVCYSGVDRAPHDWPPPYSPAAQAYFDALPVSPGLARRAREDAFIAALVAGGVWAKTIGLHVIGHDQHALRTNMRHPERVASFVNGPVPQPDHSLTGDGVSSWMDTGFVPAAEPAWLQDDCGLFCDVAPGHPLVTGSNAVDCGNERAFINTQAAAGLVQMRTQRGGGFNGSRAGTPIGGLVGWCRYGASQAGWFLNGVRSPETDGGTSTGPASDPFGLGRGGSGRFSARPQRMIWWGRALSNSEVAAFHAAWTTRLTGLADDY